MLKGTRTKDAFQKDVENIEEIPVIPDMLDVICRTTRMGFAAVARVTEETWMACSVKDDIAFGLKPGDELQIKTTICNEIRQHRQAVIIDDVAEDLDYINHHTPAMYGFRSYISVPIFKKDGSFFGTLCAIDPAPRALNTPEITGMFFLFADLISFHLHAIELVKTAEQQLRVERLQHQHSEDQNKSFTLELEKLVQERTQQLSEKNRALEKMNTELQTFTYAASHDLQEPLRKIRMYAEEINRKDADQLSERGKEYFDKIQHAAARMQSLISDLISYPQSNTSHGSYEVVNLNAILEEVKLDLANELVQKQAIIETHEVCTIHVIPFQFREVFSNLVGNSLKFSSPLRQPRISIGSRIIDGSEVKYQLPAGFTQWCHISITDNGIGFKQEHSEKIFELFQRLHNEKEYEGNGVGLAIVKKVIENHSGFIMAEGKVNEGATFHIYIPVV
jgi:signal transduction histidine kinase